MLMDFPNVAYLSLIIHQLLFPTLERPPLVSLLPVFQLLMQNKYALQLFCFPTGGT